MGHCRVQVDDGVVVSFFLCVFFFRVLSFNFIYYTTTRDIIPLNIYYKHTYNTLDKHSYTYEGPHTHTHSHISSNPNIHKFVFILILFHEERHNKTKFAIGKSIQPIYPSSFRFVSSRVRVSCVFPCCPLFAPCTLRFYRPRREISFVCVCVSVCKSTLNCTPTLVLFLGPALFCTFANMFVSLLWHLT